MLRGPPRQLPGVTTAQYDALNARLQDLPGNPFEGCLSHVAVATDSGLEIFDVWESEQAMEKFTGIVMPIAQQAGLPAMPDQSKTHQVHNYWVPGA